MTGLRVLGLVAAALAGAVAAISPAAAQLPVFDGARALDFVQEFAKLQEQLATAKSQLLEAERMYASVTGNRGFGDRLRDGKFEQYLPADARRLYDGAGGGAGISGSIQDIFREEQGRLTGTVPEMEAQLRERERMAAATGKAVGLKGYEGARARLEEIERLMDRIGEAQDPKAVGELQARLAGEQAAIQVEFNKLQLLAQLQLAEDRLIVEQRRAVSRRILDPANDGMPTIDVQIPSQ